MSASQRESRRPRSVLSAPTYPPYHSHSRIFLRVLFAAFLLLLVLVVAAVGGLYWSLHRAQGSGSAPITFPVGSGDTVNSVADRLQSRGLINSSLLFRLDAKVAGLGGLKVGQYTLRRNMSIDQMVKAFTVYHSAHIAITIVPGSRIPEIAAVLKANGIDAKSFLQEADHPNLSFLNASILNGKPGTATLEGYLFPDTYFVSPHSSGAAFAKEMVQQLNKEVTPAMRAQAKNKLNMFQTLTLASIVEREARVESERPVIAGVYNNRLQRHWLLEADPTVQYASGHAGDWWPVLQNTANLIAPSSPYNTYTHYGLPPGPICSPSLLSIEAALNPAKTKYMYFLHIPGSHGHHAFAVTYQQQLANERKYGSG